MTEGVATQYQIPDDCYYTREHEWLRIEETENGTIGYVGITDYAQHQLGDIVYVEVHTVGEHVMKGEVLGTIEAVKTTADVFSPASGTVLTWNETLQQAPQKVNEDPYGEGWIAQIQLDNPEEIQELVRAGELLQASEYRALIAGEETH